MAEVLESVGPETETRALIETLSRIRDRGQKDFNNTLEVGHSVPDPEMAAVVGQPEFYYLAQIQKSGGSGSSLTRNVRH